MADPMRNAAHKVNKLMIRPALLEDAVKLEWQRGQHRPATASGDEINSGRPQLEHDVRTASLLVSRTPEEQRHSEFLLLQGSFLSR